MSSGCGRPITGFRFSPIPTGERGGGSRARLTPLLGLLSGPGCNRKAPRPVASGVDRRPRQPESAADAKGVRPTTIRSRRRIFEEARAILVAELSSDLRLTQVAQRLQQPGAKDPFAAEALEPVKGAQKGVLAHILGLVGADDPCRDPEDDVTVAIDQLLERGQVSAPGPLDKLGIRVHLNHGSWQRRRFHRSCV